MAHTHGAVQARKALGKAVGLGVDDEVDAPAVQQHVLVAGVPRV